MPRNEPGTIGFDYDANRPVLAGIHIHCGDVIAIRPAGTWRVVRVEWDHGRREWYLVTGDDTAEDLVVGTPARWPV